MSEVKEVETTADPSNETSVTTRLVMVAICSVLLTLMTVGFVHNGIYEFKRHEKVSQGLERQKQENATKDFVAPLSDEGMVADKLSWAPAMESILNAPDVEVRMEDKTPDLRVCQTLVWFVPMEAVFDTADVVTDVDNNGDVTTSTGIYRKKIEDVYTYILSHPEMKPKAELGCYKDNEASHSETPLERDGWMVYSDGTRVEEVHFKRSGSITSNPRYWTSTNQLGEERSDRSIELPVAPGIEISSGPTKYNLDGTTTK